MRVIVKTDGQMDFFGPGIKSEAFVYTALMCFFAFTLI